MRSPLSRFSPGNHANNQLLHYIDSPFSQCGQCDVKQSFKLITGVVLQPHILILHSLKPVRSHVLPILVQTQRPLRHFTAPLAPQSLLKTSKPAQPSSTRTTPPAKSSGKSKARSSKRGLAQTPTSCLCTCSPPQDLTTS